MDNNELGYTLGRLCALVEFLHDSFRNEYGRIADIALIARQPFNMTRQFTSAISDCIKKLPEYDPLMMEIVDNLPATELPKHMSLEQQGQFMHGYYKEKLHLKTYNIQIGNNIARIRKEKGMSQQDLAEACGIIASHIGRIELGKYSIRTDQLYKIAFGLGVHPAELLS